MGKPNLRFGWVVNAHSDGFESEHGRFTVEVFWSRDNWHSIVWNEHNTIVHQAKHGLDLDEAKRAAHEQATRLEKEAVRADRTATKTRLDSKVSVK